MNWREIEEKYPRAFKIVDLFGNVTLEHSPNIRSLYDFFDQNGVYVVILKDYCEAEAVNNLWTAEVNYIETNYVYKSRAEAETAAFTKAFEILEQKLTK